MTTLFAAIVVTVAGATGIWSTPYVAPVPAPAVEVEVEAIAPAPTTTTAAPTTTITTAPEPCAVASLFWVDEWTVTVESVSGPEGHGFTASGVGHFVNYEHNDGPRKSIAPDPGQAQVTLCP
jgi:hypothetical protein